MRQSAAATTRWAVIIVGEAWHADPWHDFVGGTAGHWLLASPFFVDLGDRAVSLHAFYDLLELFAHFCAGRMEGHGAHATRFDH